MYVILLAVMIFISAALSGIFAPPFQKGKAVSAIKDGYTCCDTGDGEECQPRGDVPSVTFKNSEYRLLKSNIYMDTHHAFHLNPAPPGNVRIGRDNLRVFENPSEGATYKRHPECLDGKPGNDRLYGAPTKEVLAENRPYGCYEIPNDILIYLCRKDSPPGSCDRSAYRKEYKIQALFDVYIRMSDVNQSGIPNVIKNCFKPEVTAPPKEKQIGFRVSPGGQQNLQLRTFEFVVGDSKGTWVSPYCKPAIYLYPKRKAEINVSVFPQGKMLLTIPPYPKKGWDVVADPNGDIYHGNKVFDYLYYEASIPDQLIRKPQDGYVIPFDDREQFLQNLVQKLGLNEKETRQFVEYWTPILPESPYYFVGIIPVSNLSTISPLLITPKPDNLIRVTLYFQALDKKISVSPPTILPVSRSGYTAVEWGGIVKQDKDHPFSCYM
jgi:hypothetical protein